MTGEIRVVGSARDLLDVTTLADINYYQLVGERFSDDAPESTETDGPAPIQVLARSDDEHVEVRLRVEVRSADARFMADVGAAFELRERVEIPADVMQDFVERVGIMAAYPFVREAVHSLASRMRVEAPLLQLLQGNALKLEGGPQ